MNIQELKQALKLHARWLAGDPKGERLRIDNANLQDVNLCGTDLRNAYLFSAKLSDSDLRDANLSGAYLAHANLSYANLRNANLTNANLSNAILTGADLRDANLTNAILPYYAIVPETGSFIGWKKIANNVILKLQIPASAKRTSSLIGRRCRASKAKVLAVYSIDGTKLKEATSFSIPYNPNVLYKLNQTVVATDYNDDPRVECAKGIYFFITRKEAIKCDF